MAGSGVASQQAGQDRERSPEPAAERVAPAGRIRSRLTGGATAGNERLTAATGVLLLVVLAALGVTIIWIGPLLGAHMFIGLLLVPPVLLKMASTGYRFVRYYTHDPAYRRKGPPLAALRILAPGVVLATVLVFATGIALLLVGPSSHGSLGGIHKDSFIAWLVVTSLHVVGHLPGLPAALRAPDERGAVPGLAPLGGPGRALALAGVVVAGVVLAILYVPEFTPWLHANFHHHHH